MSALPNYAPASRRLQLVEAFQGRRVNPAGVIITLVLGFVAVVALLYMTLFVMTTESQYRLVTLKSNHAQVLEDTQILKQQVDSLSSNQNLSDAAEVLGMVSNANPVFLSVGQQQVFGEPKAALATNTGRVSGNLVGNSALSAKTSASQLRAAVAAEENAATRSVKTLKLASKQPASSASAKQSVAGANFGAAGSNVATSNGTNPQVGSTGGQIPTSPTH